ncbi:MAG: DUF6438 domain-containing protein [Methyloglobulus sp.]|nr:hypothetical protein [Methyloglobulus sp.]
MSALITGCAAGPPILTLIDHGSGMDPDISPSPDFRIELFEDGKVHYHGIKSVNVIGDRYGQIRHEQVQTMVGLYKKLADSRRGFSIATQYTCHRSVSFSWDRDTPYDWGTEHLTD